ncbi:MAG: aldo/keto reductase [Pseudomonadales bacterium]
MLPKVIFGTSSLGNLYEEPSYDTKKAIVGEIVRQSGAQAMFDSAGKYGAGLALESLGGCLADLGVEPGQVSISNKLGWKRVPLTTDEPTFEVGVWKNIQYDAVQDISYQGILDCFEQGNQLLGNYCADIVSVHDPDEFLDGARDATEHARRLEQLLEAYRALAELKQKGIVSSIGIGAKDITSIDLISDHVQLDWAMFANSITPYTHADNALSLLDKLQQQGVAVINSAVFNAGFLVGGEFFNYQKISPESHPEAFAWRDRFYAICDNFDIEPALACVQFSFLFNNIASVALNTSSAKRISTNIALATTEVPAGFWQAMLAERLINPRLASLIKQK